jgi:cold shock CspA family protein
VKVITMIGRITRLISDQQFGVIAAEDGNDYLFQSPALSQGTFGELSLGATVNFEPIIGARGAPRAGAVRLVTK